MGLVVGENYVLCLATVAIFMEFGQAGTKRCEDTLKSSIGVAMQAAR